MKTMKLRAYENPCRLERLLESLVNSRGWIAQGAQPVSDRSELPSVLQKLAIRAEKVGGAWRSWLNHDGIRFFLGEMSLALSRERGYPVLQVHYYNEQGKLQQYSLWALGPDDSWQRCTL